MERPLRRGRPKAVARWRNRLLTLIALAIAALVAHEELIRWDPESLGPGGATSAPAPLCDDELRVLTINAWLLSQPHRARALVDAVDAEGAALASGASARPELVAIQEIRSRVAVRALAREMRDEGSFASCECSVRSDGSLRSAVAAAVRAPFVARGHECVGLARILPDQRRCALIVRVADPEGRSLTFVVTHLAWNFATGVMATQLREQLAERDALGPSTIVAGDLNAWPGTEAYEVITRPPLRDARPDAPPTHFFGRAIDHVLVGRAFEVARGLDRRASYERMRPGASLWIPRICDAEGPPACPVSDHLPEGVVLRWRRGSAAGSGG